MGASAVSFILQKSLVPLAAREAFADWLIASFPSSSHLGRETILRLSGTTDGPLISAKQQLLISLEQDNALFVEEEQNLFVDEIREVELWSKTFTQISHSLKLQDKEEFVEWTIEGLLSLNALGKRDGALGWTSKPAAFVICTRILASATLILGLNEEGEDWKGKMDMIRSEVEKVKEIAELHPSLLAQRDVWISASEVKSGAK